VPVAALEDGRTVGAMLWELPLVSDLETVQVEIDVPVPHRRRGVAAALWAWGVERARAEGRTVVQTEVHVPVGESPATWPGSLLAERLGFGLEHVEDHLVVDLPVDATVLDAQPLDPAYHLVRWTGPCPEEHVSAYARLQTAMNADVPIGGMTRESVVVDEERVRTSDARVAESYLGLVTMAQTAQGEPAGYTLMLVPHEQALDVLQDDTLVLRAHRGHGLGAAMKAANLRQLGERDLGAARVHTWTAESNPPMQKVNARFGFRAVEKLHELELRGL
jgi:GNAT superfamily N-acetyltransferase